MTSSRSGEADCPFCAIAQGRAPARIVWRSDSCLAFLPDVPAVLGHTLVIPTRHVSDIWAVDSRLRLELAEATGRVAEAVAVALGTRELNLIQSNGASAGQTVFHLHVHVVPRRPGDRIPEMWPPDADWSPNTLDEVVVSLRTAIANPEPH